MSKICLLALGMLGLWGTVEAHSVSFLISGSVPAGSSVRPCPIQSDLHRPSSTSIPLQAFEINNNDPDGVEIEIRHDRQALKNYRLVVVAIEHGVSRVMTVGLDKSLCFSEKVAEDQAITDLRYELYLEPLKRTLKEPITDNFVVRTQDTSLVKEALVAVHIPCPH